MNLLAVLIKSLLSGNTLSTLMKKTGLSSRQLKKLIPLAIPLLIKMLTRNASSQEGLSSLLGALTQHTNKKPMAVQVAEADTDDGDKIIGQLRKSGFLVMEPDDLIRIFEENRKQLAMLCGRASLLLQFPGDPKQLLEDLVAFGKACGVYDPEKEERDGEKG